MLALCRHFNLDKSSVERFLVQEMIMHGKNPNTFYVSFDLAKEFKILLGNIDTKKVFITAKHLTTLSDEGSALKKYGLLNLKDVLEKDTPLNQFLQVKNIKFNIDKKKIRIHETELDLFRCTNDCKSCSIGKSNCSQFSPEYRSAIDRIYIKLYTDKSEIEVFLCGTDDEIEKYPYITRHPEFLYNIDKLLTTMQLPAILSNEWAKLQDNQFYVVEFDLCMHFLEYIPSCIYDEKPSYELFENYLDLLGYNEDDFLSERIPNDFYYNIFLIKNSLDVFFTGKGKEYGQILPEIKIPFSDLRVIRKLIL